MNLDFGAPYMAFKEINAIELSRCGMPPVWGQNNQSLMTLVKSCLFRSLRVSVMVNASLPMRTAGASWQTVND